MFSELRTKLTSQEQMSEAFILGLVLAFAGGFFDAYTYITRGGVFSNAQTGNIVVLFINLVSGDFLTMFKYLIPVASFAVGVFIVYFLSHKYKNISLIHWREIVLIFEVILIAAVGFIPDRYNMIANIIISFSCAMQVQAFRTVCGNNYASTMCTGNLRSFTVALAKYMHSKKKIELERALYYLGIIFVFGMGAGIGAVVTHNYYNKSIWFTIPALIVAILLMELDKIKK